jgi:hypothetical protein
MGQGAVIVWSMWNINSSYMRCPASTAKCETVCLLSGLLLMLPFFWVGLFIEKSASAEVLYALEWILVEAELRFPDPAMNNVRL